MEIELKEDGLGFTASLGSNKKEAGTMSMLEARSSDQNQNDQEFTKLEQLP